MRDRLDRLGSDALVEDLFGLNIRGVRTIWTMLARPRSAYEAALASPQRPISWSGAF